LSHKINTVLAILLLSACSSSGTEPPAYLPPNLTMLYGVDDAFRALYTVDIAIGVHTIVGSPGQGRLDAPSSMAVRPVDGELFVYNNVGSSDFRRYWGLVRLDRCTGFATRIGPKTLSHTTVGALAFAPDGRLYAFGRSEPEAKGYPTLFQIDPNTGDYSEIGRVERRALYSVSAADFHPDGDLYGIGAPPESGDSIQMLIIVDIDTGRPSVVGEISHDVGLIESVVFEPSGMLLGAGVRGTGEKLLFEIDPATAAVSSIRRSTVAARGMGFAPPGGC
jgi:hypothetical protein